MAQVGGSSSIWDTSPYTMFRNDNEQEEQDDPEKEEDATRQVYLPSIIISEPPPGYFTEFNAETTGEDVHTQFSEQGSLLSDPNTTIGRVAKLVTMDPANSIHNKEVQQQSKLGAKFMDSITKVPLSDFWHRITQGVAFLIFGTNVVSAIYDLAHDPINLHYKVPNIFFGVIANILLIGWFQLRPNVMKTGSSDEDGKKKKDKNTNTNNKKKKKKGQTKKGDKENEDEKKKGDKEKNKKYQQYAENILHEALLYPIIVLSVFGFANDKMYKISTDWFSMLQFVLIVIDAIDVLWTQIMRIIMIHRFLEDMKSVLGVTVKDIGTILGMNILLRGIFTTVLNFVLFVFLILLLGAQVHTDNFNNNDDMLGYRGSVNSTFLLVAVITLPLFNLVVFIAVNYHWIVELLLVLGAESTKDAQKGAKKKQIKQPGIVTLATDAALSSDGIKKKLEDMRKIHPFQRFISVTMEPVIVLMIVIWEVILVLAVYYFDGCEHTFGCHNTVVQVIFVVIAVVSNMHAVIVALLFNAGVVVVFMALLVYPVSVPLFLRGKSS